MKALTEIKYDTEKMLKLEWQHKVVSKYELNS